MFDLVKWGILIKVLPWTGLFCAIKLGLHWLKEGKEFTVVDNSIDRLNPLLAKILVQHQIPDFLKKSGI